jgi:hypothetical protein
MDNISKCAQTKVNSVCLFLTSSISACLGRLLTARKIHKGNFAYCADISVNIGTINQDAENQMGATTRIIHQSFPCPSSS